MIERRTVPKTPREHFMRAAEDELARFVQKELAFLRAEREERALRLRLPITSLGRPPRAGQILEG